MHSPRAAWDALLEARSPKTQWTRPALLRKLDDVKVAVEKDPIAQLVDLGSTARRLQCYEHFKHLNDALVLSKFVNALPYEHEIQKLLEGGKGGLRREEVVSAVRGRYESSAFKQLLERKGSASVGALIARGQLCKAGGSRRGRKAQGQKREGDGGPGGDGDDGDEMGSTASTSSVGSDPPGMRCHVCSEMTTHRARNRPERRCFRCGEKGYSAGKCNNEDTALVFSEEATADAPVCSDAEGEAF